MYMEYCKLVKCSEGTIQLHKLYKAVAYYSIIMQKPAYNDMHWVSLQPPTNDPMQTFINRSLDELLKQQMILIIVTLVWKTDQIVIFGISRNNDFKY